MARTADRLPVELSVPHLAKLERTLQGTVALRQFARLVDCLREPGSTTDVSLDLQFWQHELNPWHMVRGHFSTVCSLTCRLCNEAVSHRFEGDFELALVYSEADFNTAEKTHDAVLLERSGSIRVIDLIEDELILSLPSVCHADDEFCAARQYLSTDAGV